MTKRLSDMFKEFETYEKKETQKELKIKVINVSTTPRILNEDTQSINSSITIRKLMAMREMFNLKSPKKVNKQSLASLIIKALKTME